MVKENQKTLNAFVVVMDIGCVLASMLLACCTQIPFSSGVSGRNSLWEYIYYLVAILPAYPLAFYFAGLYGSRRHKRFIRELIAILYCAGAMFVLLLVLLYAVGLPHYLGFYIAIFTFYFILIDSSARYALRRLLRLVRKKGFNLKYLLLIGGGNLASQFIRKVTGNPQYGYRFSGCLTDNADAEKQLAGVSVLGPVSSLEQHISNRGVDEVVIALELEEYGKIPPIIAQCEKNGVKANIVPAYFQYIPSNPRMDEFDGIPVMVLRKIPLTNPFNAALKRLFDITGSLICIIIFSPVMLVSWAVIRFTTGEAAIYKQERVGYRFRRFTMYKFRTMKSEEDERRWTKKKDNRRTRFGAFIRKLSIDELPQFFNVLSGSMSIVGPRPEIAEFVEQFKEKIPRYMVRHQVKPGITGWAQIHNLRGDTSIEERVGSDIYYIENWSPALDIQIVIRTFMYAFYNPNE